MREIRLSGSEGGGTLLRAPYPYQETQKRVSCVTPPRWPRARARPRGWASDFIIRLNANPPTHLILETKGFDPLEEVKRAATERWVNAVNAEGSFGQWAFALAKKTTDVSAMITHAVNSLAKELPLQVE